MKNYELNHFRPQPLCDCHVHPHMPLPLDRSVEIYRTVMEHTNCERIALQCLPDHDVTDNYKAFYFKSKINGVYVGSGLFHHFDERDTREYYLEQAKTCRAMGCDGFKMLEGKPDYRKRLGKPLDDPSLDGFYGYAEENEIHVLMHLGDPREFWDINRIPKWALERGWLYDDSFVHFDNQVKEIEGILNKFPKLHLTLAHFFFTSDNIDYAYSFMERYENACFDLTPGSEMYRNFNERSDEWKQFFIKYADRILYGTDIYNWTFDANNPEGRFGRAPSLERGFLESREPFFSGWFQKTFEHPFGLEDDVLDKIYHDNFIRLYGAEPRPMDAERIVAETRKFMQEHTLDELQTANMQQVIDHFSR